MREQNGTFIGGVIPVLITIMELEFAPRIVAALCCAFVSYPTLTAPGSRLR